MKRIYWILIVVTLSACNTSQAKQEPLEPLREVSVEQVQTPETEWSLYSKALMHINRGQKLLQDKKSADIEFKKALSILLQMKESDEAPERINYHIAQCYYYLYVFNDAIKYAKRAISHSPKYEDPYMMIYRVYVNLRNYDEAADTLEKLIKERPDLVQVRLNLATLYYSQIKNPEKAKEHYLNILEYEKHESIHSYYVEQAHYYLGHIYYKNDDLQASEYHFSEAFKTNPGNNSTLYILAALNMEVYDLDDARYYLKLYYKKYPDNIKINSYLGRVLYMLDDPSDLVYLRTAGKSKTMEGYIAKALYLERLKQDKESLPLLKNVMKRDPSLITPHIATGNIALRNGHKKTALTNFFTAGVLFNRVGLNQLSQRYLRKALAIDDTIPEIFFYLGKSYEENQQYSMAIINYKKTYEMKPSNDLLLHIGYLYSLDKNYTAAIEHIDIAISKDPENPQHYFFKGLIYSDKKEYEIAEKMLQRAIELNGKNDSYYFYLATVQDQQKKLEKTIDSLKKAIKYNPKSARAYNYLGYLYADNNMKLDESVDLIKKALDIEPANGAYLDSLGWAYYRQGKYKDSLDKLLKAEIQLKKDNEEDPVVLDHLGDVYQKLGNTQKAIEYWERALKLKDNPEIRQKIKDIKK